MPLWKALLWTPLWLVLLPVMGVIAPLSGMMLGRYDKDTRFTIGYHVTAVRNRDDRQG